MTYNKSVTTIIALALFIGGTVFATTLINPTGDGGFETGTTFPLNGWTAVNGTNNQWYVGSAPVVYAGTNCAFTGSSSISWTGEAFTNVNHFYRDVSIPSGEGAIQLKFWYKVASPDAGYDQLKVFFVPTSTTPVAGTQLSSGQIGIIYETATTWTEVTIDFSATPGTTQRLVFSWRTDGVTPHAAVAVDNISLTSAPVPSTPSTSNYTFSYVSNGSLTDMSSGTTQLVGATQDDSSSAVTNIGFDFWFMSTRYTQFSASSNGLMALGSTQVGAYTYATPQSSQPLIAPFVRDLCISATGKTHYKVIGSAPNRTLVVEWSNMEIDYSSSTADGTYQARLYEGTGVIEFVYGSMSVGVGGTATGFCLGISSSNTDNTFATITTSTNTVNTTGTPATNTYTAGASIPNLNSTSQGSRTIYTFTPPTPADPTYLSFTSIGYAGMTLNWTDNATNEWGYVIYRSNDGGATYAFQEQIAAGSTSSIRSGLTPATTYYWKVYAVTEGAMSNALSGSQATLTGTVGGIKTIDNTGAGNYISFTAAITDLNTNFVAPGGVTFNVVAGQTFNENPPAITTPGSISDPIVFQKSGIGVNPIIIPSTAGTLIASAFTTSLGDAVIKIAGGDYITFNGIDVQDYAAGANDAQRMEFGYLLMKNPSNDACKYITIKNCAITLNRVTTNSSGILVSNFDSLGTAIIPTTTGGRSENIKIFSNTISNVYNGIATRGYLASTPYDLYDQNIEIGVDGGNNISNYGGGASNTPYAIYAIYANNIKINNNIISGGTGTTTTMRAIYTSTGVNSNVDIVGNDVSITSSATTSGLYGIENAMGASGTTNTININNNVVHDCTYPTATSGAFYGIYNSVAAASVNMNNNTLRDNILPGTGSFYGIYAAGSPTNLTMSSNNVYGNQKTGASGYMYCTYATTSIITYSLNNIYNNSIPSTSGTSAAYLYGYYNLSSPTVENYYGNNIYNLTIAGTTTSTSCILNGIYTYTISTSVKNIYNNNIYGLSSHIGTCAGIRNNAGNTVNIFNNKIYNITNTAGTVDGLNLTTTMTTNVYNNFISDLKAPNSANVNAINGINYISSTSGNVLNVYYNTIYLDATSAGANFGSSAIYVSSANPTVNLRNNIFINTSTANGTGLTVAHRRTGTDLTTYALTSNNNCFYAGTPSASRLIFYDGTNSDQTITAYKTRVAPRDNLSVTEAVNFTSATDLHINSAIATNIESGAAPITGITTDIDGDTRVGGSKSSNVRPDIGADEFSGNSIVTVPTYSGPYDIGTGYTYTTLKSFFDAINAGVVTGAITATIRTDLTEVSTAMLYPVVYDASGPWKILIKPSATDDNRAPLKGRTPPYTVSGNIAGPLVDLYGADYVTFDGQGKNLTFRNINVSGQVFRFINDATYDTIKSCIIEGCGTSTSYASIYIYTSATGTLGNSYNVISGNDIRDLSTTAARPYNAIYSYGTSTAPNNSNTICDNNIFNYTYYGVYIGSTGNGGNWTIARNSFYYNNTTALSTGLYSIYFYPGATANSNMIYGNFIGGQAPNCGGTALTTSASFYGIYAYSFGTSVKSYIRKNTIKNITLTNTGAYGFYGIYIYTGGTADIDSNTIGDPSVAARDLAVPSYSNNISLSNTTTLREERIGKADNGMTLDMDVCQDQPEPDFVTSASASTVIKPDFTENSISTAGTSVTYGIYSYTAYPIKIEANEVSNMTANGTGTGVACRGIVVAAAATCTAYVNSNVVHHIKSYGTSTSYGGTATGVYYWPGGFCPYGRFYNNTAYTISAANNTAVQTTAVGLIVNNTAIPAYNNKAYDIRNASTGITSTTPPTAVGMVVGATSYPAVYNNMISVGDGQTTNTEFIGIWNYFGTNNGYGLYNNSVWVMGTCTDGALPSFGYLRGNNTGTSVVTRTDGKNNIFLNTRTGGTGKHYAVANQATTADIFGWWFNYNVLNTTNPATLGLWGITDLTFNDWKLPHPAGSGGDANSINADPGYMGVTDLHINPNSLVPNRKAIPIVDITIDFDGEARHPMYPDIGADEYTPNAPSTFNLISPVNGATNVLLSGQLVWNKATLAQYYDVYLSVDSPPVVKVCSLQTDTSYGYTLMPNTTYYWKVVAQNDTGVIEGSVPSAVWSFQTEIWDVGATAIIKPSAIGFAGNVIIPKVKVKNFGSAMVSFPVTMIIGSGYTDTTTVNNLMAGDSLIVNFDPWTAALGTYNLLAYTNLVLDNNYANDTVRGSVEIQPPAHNVGTMEIIAPMDTIVEGTVVTPRARIKNFGAYTETFTVRFKIGEVYNQVDTIHNFESGAESLLSFPNWTAVRCNYVVSCSTELEIDQLPEDDKITEMTTVKYSDVGVVAILAPRDTVITCNDYTPMAVISNNGVHTYPALCSVMVKILRYPAQMTSYCNIGPAATANVMYESWMTTELAMGEVDTIYFPEWHPYWWDIYWTSAPMRHLVIAEVKMAADMDSTNNTLQNPLIVKGRSNDLQVNWAGLLSGNNPPPTETIPITTYNVASVVSNSPLGPTAVFRAFSRIIRNRDSAVVYSKYLDRTLNPQTYACLYFQSGWVPEEAGWYLVKSWIQARPGIDMVSENNYVERLYYVRFGGANVQSNNRTTIPLVFSLLQNQPNPFKGITNISYQIPVESKVAISVYDASGRNIKTLVNENRTAGYYNTTWNCTDNNNQKVAAGVYFYEMKSSNYTERHKMVITH